MSRQKCCTCNGANAKCTSCRCARLNVKCTSCYPLRHGRCNNSNLVDLSSETSLTSSSRVSVDESIPSAGRFESQGASTLDDASPSNKDRIRNVVTLLRRCRSSLLRHIPKGSRYLFAKSFASTIEKALLVNDYDSWTRFIIFPTVCLRSPIHNGKRHCKSLSTLINKQISFFENTADTNTLIKSIDPTSSLPKSASSKRSSQQLRKSVSDKLNDGDVRGAVRLVASDASLAPYSQDILAELLEKHPQRPPDRRAFPDSSGCSNLRAITTDEVALSIKSFPLGSSGGITRLRPQHLKEALRMEVGDQRQRLLEQLTLLVNFIISKRLPDFVTPVLLGANVTALSKPDGGVRPIAVGETIRRIACKCVLKRVVRSVSTLLSPHQLGCGVLAGIDAATHSMRTKIAQASPPDILLKLDFHNAFNTMRRDHIAECLLKYAPVLLALFTSCYCDSTYLTFGNDIFLSDEGLQQGDPLAPLYFCLGLHDILLGLQSPFKIAYLDDVALLGDPSSVLNDVTHFLHSCSEIGLKLNSKKCELICLADGNEEHPRIFREILPELKAVNRHDAIFLGSAMGEASLEIMLKGFIAMTNKFHDRLQMIPAHDALFLLRNCFAIPKLLHTLRTSPSFQRLDLLSAIDDAILRSVSSILNVNLSVVQNSQISLPTKLGGFGIFSAASIASSAFLSSLYAANNTCHAISSEWSLENNTLYHDALTHWESKCPTVPRPVEALDRQKSWTIPLHAHQASLLLTSAVDQDRARLLACRAQGSGDWLNALPATSLGLHLNNDQLRTAAAIRLGAPVSLDHVCSLCGSLADGRGQHALCCVKSTGRHLRHRLMNDVVNRALHSIPIPTRLEPTGLLRDSTLKPDGVTLIPWTSGKPLAWDVTCAHPLAQSWRVTSQRNEAAVATAVEVRKYSKYKDFDVDFHFEPVSVETLGGLGNSTRAFIKHLGGRITAATGDALSTSYLRQRLAIAIQIGNHACLAETLPLPGSSLPPTDL